MKASRHVAPERLPRATRERVQADGPNLLPSPKPSLRARVAATWDRTSAQLPTWLTGRVRGAGPMRLPATEAGRGVGADRLLCGAVLLLTALGVVMVFSAGAVFAARKYGDWTYFLKRELVYAAIGVVAFWYGVSTDYAAYRKITYPLLFTCLGMLAAVLVVGSRAGGAIRWFRLGPLSFQPSEIAKFALALYLSYLLARKAEKVRDFSVGFLPPLVVTGAMMALLLKQPDLGTAAIFGVVALAMLFVAGTRTSYILLSVLVAAPVGWQFIVGTPWRMKRMLAFLDPWAHRQDAGYQITESLISIGSGGLFGRGLGDGRQKLFFLPEAHTDFILAVTGEELGLMGLLGVLGAFSVLVWRGLVASARARDAFGSYLAFGITVMFGLQGVFNMAVVMGLLPTKGLPLPFVSYGGTSLITSLFAAGVLANVSARNPVPKHAYLFGALRLRLGRSGNRRAMPVARIVVETGRKRPRRGRPGSGDWGQGPGLREQEARFEASVARAREDQHQAEGTRDSRGDIAVALPGMTPELDPARSRESSATLEAMTHDEAGAEVDGPEPDESSVESDAADAQEATGGFDSATKRRARATAEFGSPRGSVA